MSARDLFEQIIQDGWAGVQAWKATEAEESLQLEFKRQQDMTSGVFGDADRGQLAKAMSGFANVEGGVLVFGVHAREMGKNPDRVQSICPIVGVAKFQAAVEKIIPNVTDPPIAGVKVRRISDDSKPDSGVVVVYVPQSDGGPHRAVNATAEVNDRYYMRTATQTVKMPHAILAAMFGRAPPPRLQLISDLRLSSGIGYGKGSLSFVVRLRNIGRGCAQLPAVRIFAEPTEAGIHGQFHLGHHPAWIPESLEGPTSGVLIRATPDIVIYPSQEVTLNRDNLTQVDLSDGKVHVRLRGDLYALNMQPVHFDEERVMSPGLPGGLWPLVTPSYSDD